MLRNPLPSGSLYPCKIDTSFKVDDRGSMTQKKVQLSIEDQPQESDQRAFWDILRAYNRSQAELSNHKPICIFLRDETGKIVGGLDGETYWSWLFVENLAVDESFRHSGLGSKLLLAAEEEATKRGCIAAYLDTFSFQALPFYEKHGYSVFGILDDFPPGQKRFFLRKSLV